jgi:hypothetical protein
MPRKSNIVKETPVVLVEDTKIKEVVLVVAPVEVEEVPVIVKKTRISKKNTIAKEVVKEEVVKEKKAIKEKKVSKDKELEVSVKPKRGRKSKKELLASLNMSPNILHLQVNEIDNDTTNLANDVTNMTLTNDNIKNDIIELADDESDDDVVDENKKIVKKRGRKPKGGKIIQQVVLNETQKIDKPNVILHLKCSMKDLQQESSCVIESYNFNSCELAYDTINTINTINSKNDNLKHSITKNVSSSINDIKGFNITPNINNNNNNNDYNNYEDESDEDDYSDKSCAKDVWRKLKQLEHNLHINNINNKKSACFWCTCDFDNPPVYVPKHFINGTYHVYGCFCSPECGVAHLMNEPIDSSAKFERYHLLNHIYSKIYDYKKNIKPAPNPYYMLEKFYGNLSIQEYRSLLRNERLFLIVDKPLTRILPELHEDNDEFILNNKIIPSNNYQLKSRMQKKKPSKGVIMNEKFGLASV